MIDEPATALPDFDHIKTLVTLMGSLVLITVLAWASRIGMRL